MTRYRIGRIVIGLVAIVLLLAGVLKLLNLGAEDMLDGLEKSRLIGHKTIISLTAIASGLLLLIPTTHRIGIFMATAYWGGAIVAHMTYNDSIMMPAAFQATLWVGILLAHPEIFIVSNPATPHP